MSNNFVLAYVQYFAGAQLNDLTVLFQTILFSLSTVFVYTQLNVKQLISNN